jgi:RNA polymerase sigma-70 factor (ECF subfamily)
MKPEAPMEPSNSRVKPGSEERKGDAAAASPQGPPADEARLLTRCRAGDTGAFRILVERYQHRVVGIAFRIVRSRPDAEEIAQDAFVKAWLGLKEFRGDAAFSTWLYRIVAHRALDRVEALKNRRAREEPLEDAVAVAASADHAPAGPDSRRIARLMALLPEAQRAAVALFYFEEQSVAEIAILLKMPEGTVKTNLSRARAALRKEWERGERLEVSDEL